MTDLQELDFYLGGLPENINQWTNGKFQKGFSGCIHHIDTENWPQIEGTEIEYGAGDLMIFTDMNMVISSTQMHVPLILNLHYP